MDQRGSFCPFPLSSETTAKGTGLGVMAGKEDPVELDSILTLWSGVDGVEYVGVMKQFWNTTASIAALLI